MNQANKGSAGVIAIVIIVMLIVGLVMVNQWLQKQAGEITSQPIVTSTAALTSAPVKKEAPKIKRTGEVIRKTRFSPDRKYEINIFYQGGVEVARNKTSNGNAYDQTGEIPDGKVKFINASNETYGVEYYRDQKRHGSANIYYSDDVLKQEIDYQYGKLMTNKEYYHDGSVRMEEDYSNARDSRGEEEVGIGKVYSRDGTLRYEWFMTVTEPIGYKKSYNSNGDLVAEFYYDEYDQPMEPKEEALSPDASPSVEAPISTDVPRNIHMLSGPDTPPTVDKPPKQIFVPAS